MIKILGMNKEIRMANKIKKLLNKRGFIVNIKQAKKSNSVYLKIDNGACGDIRISNHKNRKSNCTYNMIKNYDGVLSHYKNGKIQHYYSYISIGRLINDIEKERSNSIIRYGYFNYKKIRNNKFYNNEKVA